MSASVAVPELRQVSGVIPRDFIESIRALMVNNNEQTNRRDRAGLLEAIRQQQEQQEVVQEEENVKEETAKPSKFKFVSKIKEWVEVKKEKRENKIFQKVRNQMVCNALGVTPKEMEKFKKDLANKQDVRTTEATSGDLLKDSRDVYTGQEGANYRAKRDLVITGLAGTITIARLLIPSFKAFMDLSVVVGSMAVCTVLWATRKFRKARKTNTADASEKYRNYMEKLEGFMNESDDFLQLVEKDNKLIMEQRKNLSKKEFKKWCEEYSKQKYNDLKQQIAQQQETKDEAQI